MRAGFYLEVLVASFTGSGFDERDESWVLSCSFLSESFENGWKGMWFVCWWFLWVLDGRIACLSFLQFFDIGWLLCCSGWMDRYDVCVLYWVGVSWCAFACGGGTLPPSFVLVVLVGRGVYMDGCMMVLWWWEWIERCERREEKIKARLIQEEEENYV